MQSYISNRWNYSIAFLRMHIEEHTLSNGTCFFWSHGNKISLVTNWHNLSGRNPHTDQPMSPTGALPDRVSFIALKRISEPDSDGFFRLECFPLEVKLYASDNTTPVWFEHPSLGKDVDVAAIDVTEAVRDFEVATVNALESDACLEVSASQDVFIVGFPFGLIANAPVPIWKRGTVALDPTFNPQELPKMLVDTATREGMSGSPVIARHTIINKDYPKKDGSMSKKILYGTLNTIVGVYSGRHYPDLEKAQLGIVWKRKTIEETVQSRKIASAKY